MGEIKRKRKNYSRPKKAFDGQRIQSDKALVEKYGLKNRKEIWKADSEISKIRRGAKKLVGKSGELKNAFFSKLSARGLRVGEIADVLELTGEDLLKRRLQTIMFNKKLANTPKQARQLIVHKKVLVDGQIVNKPGMQVDKTVEDKISLVEPKKKAIKSIEEKDNQSDKIEEELNSDKEN